MFASAPRRGEDGFSLVESVIAVAILGIIATAMVGGMATAITMSGVHRQQASANWLTVSAAEVVKHLPYLPCPHPGENWTGPNVPRYLPEIAEAVPVPSGWSITIAAQYWDSPSGFGATCPDDSHDPGFQFPLQQLTICAVFSGQGSVPKPTPCIDIVKRKP